MGALILDLHLGVICYATILARVLFFFGFQSFCFTIQRILHMFRLFGVYQGHYMAFGGII